ncbi:MAG: amidohydrolase [Lewinellaceae bacterium]|nr:amidohydrolase [Lewinellaceae bacterium]
MKIFDCHLHIEQGLDNYNIITERKNVIFNHIESYRKYSDSLMPSDTISLIFDYKNHFEYIKNLVEERTINALKIHSRIQKIRLFDYDKLYDRFQIIANKDLPVIIDSFYYGSDYEVQPNMAKSIEMIKMFPNTKFIIAHAGGIKVMEYFLHMKNLENVYFELSLSLAYLRYASVFQDYKALLKFGNYDKILFGTDYPFINPKQQLSTFLHIAKELKIPDKDLQKILYDNAKSIFTFEPLTRHGY